MANLAGRETSQSNRVRILIADDHPIFRDALRKLLESEPGFAVVGQAGDGDETVRLAHILLPDLLILDLDMPSRSGMEALRSLAAVGATVRVVVLAGTTGKADLFQAFRLGARGVVLKESTAQDLFRSIRCVIDGGYWVARQDFGNLAQALRSLVPTKISVTPRELEVLAAIVRGSTNKDIAEELSLSDETVRHYVASLFEKLGVSNRVEAALYAVKNRLLD